MQFGWKVRRFSRVWTWIANQTCFGPGVRLFVMKCRSYCAVWECSIRRVMQSDALGRSARTIPWPEPLNATAPRRVEGWSQKRIAFLAVILSLRRRIVRDSQVRPRGVPAARNSRWSSVYEVGRILPLNAIFIGPFHANFCFRPSRSARLHRCFASGRVGEPMRSASS